VEVEFACEGPGPSVDLFGFVLCPVSNGHYISLVPVFAPFTGVDITDST